MIASRVVTVATNTRGEAICSPRLERLMDAQQRFLDDVLGIGHAAEHLVGDRERDRPQFLQQSLTIGHVAASPCRRLTRPGRHASSRLGPTPIVKLARATNHLHLKGKKALPAVTLKFKTPKRWIPHLVLGTPILGGALRL